MAGEEVAGKAGVIGAGVDFPALGAFHEQEGPSGDLILVVEFGNGGDDILLGGFPELFERDVGVGIRIVAFILRIAHFVLDFSHPGPDEAGQLGGWQGFFGDE